MKMKKKKDDIPNRLKLESKTIHCMIMEMGRRGKRGGG
jgi:uncharacterized protein (DUF169 family)